MARRGTAHAVRSRRAVSATVGVLGTVLLVTAWEAIGPDRPVFAVVVGMLSFGLVPFVGDAVAPHLPRWLVDAQPRERRLHRILLVPQVISLLDAVGWNTFIGRRPGSGSTREGLRAIERSTRGNIAAHGVGAGVHLVVGIACAVGGSADVALLVLALGAVMHVWPVLIQRAVRLRLMPLLARL